MLKRRSADNFVMGSRFAEVRYAAASGGKLPSEGHPGGGGTKGEVHTLRNTLLLFSSLVLTVNLLKKRLKLVGLYKVGQAVEGSDIWWRGHGAVRSPRFW